MRAKAGLDCEQSLSLSLENPREERKQLSKHEIRSASHARPPSGARALLAAVPRIFEQKRDCSQSIRNLVLPGLYGLYLARLDDMFSFPKQKGLDFSVLPKFEVAFL